MQLGPPITMFCWPGPRLAMDLNLHLLPRTKTALRNFGLAWNLYILGGQGEENQEIPGISGCSWSCPHRGQWPGDFAGRVCRVGPDGAGGTTCYSDQTGLTI